MTEPLPASGGDSIAVVATAETANRARRVARALHESGHEVTFVVPPPLASSAREGLDVIPVPDPELEITPPYLGWSYALNGALSHDGFDAIVFPSLGGHGYCAARAREVGASFASTAIIVDCSDLTLRRAERDGHPFLSKRLLGTGVTERIVLKLADAFMCDDETRGWLERRAWEMPARRLPAPDGRTRWAMQFESRTVPGAADSPLVSVVVAFHERTSYLRFCLDALARQTHRALEVIVADDGSRSAAAAKHLEEIERLSWPWPLRVLRLPHGGLGAARNGGWRAASSDLVLFLDDDDVAFDELVATLVRARAVSGADVVVGGARFFRGEGLPIARADDVIRISLCEPRELGLISNQYGGPVNLWPRDWLERLGGFASMPTEDWDLLARATYAGARLTTPPDPLYWYRQTPSGMYSADPLAFRDAGQAARTGHLAEHLPDEWRLLPQLAAGAYSELERRKRLARPRWRTAAERGRLLAKRARQVRSEEGISAVARQLVRFARRRYDRPR